VRHKKKITLMQINCVHLRETVIEYIQD